MLLSKIIKNYCFAIIVSLNEFDCFIHHYCRLFRKSKMKAKDSEVKYVPTKYPRLVYEYVSVPGHNVSQMD